MPHLTDGAPRAAATATLLLTAAFLLLTVAARPALAAPRDLIIDPPAGTRATTEAEGATGPWTPQRLEAQGATAAEVAGARELLANGALGWVQTFTDDADRVWSVLALELPDEDVARSTLFGELHLAPDSGARGEPVELAGATAFRMPAPGGLHEDTTVWTVMFARGRHLVTVTGLSVTGRIVLADVVEVARLQAERVPGAVIDPDGGSPQRQAAYHASKAVFAVLRTALIPIGVIAAMRARRRKRADLPVLDAAPGTWGAAASSSPGGTGAAATGWSTSIPRPPGSAPSVPSPPSWGSPS